MSIIHDIEIKNFKSIRHQKIEGCKRINVFVGPPNVGKSNILEALAIPSAHFFRDDKKSLRNLFRFEKSSNLFFENDESQEIEIVINNSSVFSLFSRTETEQGLAHRFKYQDDKHDQFRIKKYQFNNDVIFNNSSSYWNLEFPFGNNLPGILSNNHRLIDIVSDLFEKTGIELLIDIHKQLENLDGKTKGTENGEIVLVRIVDKRIKLKIPYVLVADTLKRLVFYLAAILSNKESVLLFEEPEANCYEPYIMEITNAIKNDENKNQFFIVTHSQYVIDELMRDEESRNDTNIYLVGLDNNETKIKLLGPEASKEAYQTGLNLFFNYQSLWDEN